jgi:hypothetical protein
MQHPRQTLPPRLTRLVQQWFIDTRLARVTVQPCGRGRFVPFIPNVISHIKCQPYIQTVRL